jgi:hypothetical protein
LTIAFRQRNGSFALANRLPMVSELREFAEASLGGLPPAEKKHLDQTTGRSSWSMRAEEIASSAATAGDLLI